MCGRFRADCFFALLPLLCCFVVELCAGKIEINPPQAPDTESVTAIVGGRLIDGRGGYPVEDSIVLVRGAEKGRAYQRELELLIDCGMTPLEAIAAGTVWNARFFDIEDRLGTIENGKLADLLIVEGDPSKQIDDLARVQKVMLNGKWVELVADQKGF